DSRLFRTINGQATQYMFFTASVTVFSAAIAVDEATALMAVTVATTSLNTGILLSRGEKQRGDEIESDRHRDQDGCQYQPGLDEPIRQRVRARLAVGAGIR